MSNPPTNSSPFRALCQLALALVGAAVVARLGQLAFTAAPRTNVAVEVHACAATEASLSNAPAKTASLSTAEADAELAELYKSCPLAAVVDLQTIANSPEKVDAILPPYHETAARMPNAPSDEAVPRIYYPVHVGGTSTASELRVAEVPRVAAKTSKSSGEWLIDPKEWLGSEKAEQKTPAGPPSSDDGENKGEAQTSVEPNAPASEKSPAEPQPAKAEPATQPESASGQDSDPPTENTTTPPDDSTPKASTPSPIFSPPPPAASQPAEQLPTPPGTPTAVPAPANPPPGLTGAAPASAGKPPAVDPHLELFTKSAYPSARECAVCHEEIYQQWSVSAHAYAAVSPMFNKFEQRLNDLSHGTVGYFCMRCHAPVATSLCAKRDQPLWTLPEAAREGITCVACHRVQYAYGKSNGERRIEMGDINAPVFGGIGGDGVADAIAHKDQLKVKTSPAEKGPGQNIHIAGIYFQPLTRSEFCTPCHQVAVYPGIKLEVVWEQYRASPACKKGIQCQDCHMGKVPGIAAGYECGPIAKIAGKTVNDNRKKSNHIFYGPNYPIAHPGVFPFNLKANRWTMDQWLTFDWRAGWGTKEFEDRIENKQLQVTFPPLWAEVDDRLDARNNR